MTVRRRLWPLGVLAMVPIAGLALVTGQMNQRSPASAVHSHAVYIPISDFTAETAPPPTRGLIITSLRSGGASAAAGLAVGDIVVAINGRPVADPGHSMRDLRTEGHDRLSLDVTRGRQVRHIILARYGDARHGT